MIINTNPGAAMAARILGNHPVPCRSRFRDCPLVPKLPLHRMMRLAPESP